MLRLLLTAIVAISAQFANADTRDSKPFLFDGSEQNLTLAAQKTHTEYRSETREKTCWRHEFMGYRRECNWRWEPVCHNERTCEVVNNVRHCYDRRVCHNENRYYCYDVPEYRDVPYTCYETIQIPYEVKDYDVQARVAVKLENAPQGVALREGFNLDLVGEQLVLKAQNPKGQWLVFANKDVYGNLAGGLKTVDATFKLTFVPAVALAAPLSDAPQAVASTDGEAVTFSTRQMIRPDLFNVRVLVERTKFLASDVTVVDLVVPAASLIADASGNTTRFATTLSALGFPKEKREKGKYKITVTVKAVVDSARLVNPQNLPEKLEVTGEGKFKLP